MSESKLPVKPFISSDGWDLDRAICDRRNKSRSSELITGCVRIQYLFEIVILVKVSGDIFNEKTTSPEHMPPLCCLIVNRLQLFLVES